MGDIGDARPAVGERSVVLVVDDEPRNRALVRSYLQGSYIVREAKDGVTALEVISVDPVDVVLLDVMMPGLSGFDTCRRIKQLSGDIYLPVILLTALGEQEDRNAGLEAGADDYLTKPVDRRELLLRVRTFERLRRQDRQIHRQLEELRYLDALKDDLVSLIVHDLRNPLFALITFLNVLSRELQTSQFAEDVDVALRSATAIRDIVSDLLQVRLLEEGRVQPNRVPCSPRELVGDAIRAMAASARERNVDLALAPGDDVPFEADSKLVKRAIENLLVNAIRYTHAGESVEVSVAASSGGVVIEVADRGPGVPEALRDSLFDKFGSVEARLGQERRGFGLGLYGVKLMAGAHGGRVSVRDREGGGSIFAIWLPSRGG